MCLSQITWEYESVPDEEGPEYGWKVFIVTDPTPDEEGPELIGADPLDSRLQSMYFDYYYKESRILASEAVDLLSADNSVYLSGFHIYLNYDDAVRLRQNLDHLLHTRYAIRKVSFWGDITHGHEKGAPVVVSPSMLIHPWEPSCVPQPKGT